MIAPFVMNLTALPAFVDARRLELAAILVTARHIAFLNRTGGDPSAVLCGDTLVSALRDWNYDCR
jgi:hypothetical protein